jgi:hypothetical protein
VAGRPGASKPWEAAPPNCPHVVRRRSGATPTGAPGGPNDTAPAHRLLDGGRRRRLHASTGTATPAWSVAALPLRAGTIRGDRQAGPAQLVGHLSATLGGARAANWRRRPPPYPGHCRDMATWGIGRWNGRRHCSVVPMPSRRGHPPVEAWSLPARIAASGATPARAHRSAGEGLQRSHTPKPRNSSCPTERRRHDRRARGGGAGLRGDV